MKLKGAIRRSLVANGPSVYASLHRGDCERCPGVYPVSARGANDLLLRAVHGDQGYLPEPDVDFVGSPIDVRRGYRPPIMKGPIACSALVYGYVFEGFRNLCPG
jgi:hypothetical protein